MRGPAQKGAQALGGFAGEMVEELAVERDLPKSGQRGVLVFDADEPLLSFELDGGNRAEFGSTV